MGQNGGEYKHNMQHKGTLYIYKHLNSTEMNYINVLKVFARRADAGRNSLDPI